MTWLPSILLVWALLVPGPVTVEVRPPFAIAPGSFRPRVWIERHEGNRLVVLRRCLRSCLDGFIESTHYFPIEGATGRRLLELHRPWENLPGGDYIAQAELTRIVKGREQVIRVEQSFKSFFPENTAF